MPTPAERPDIPVIERVLADPRVREGLGASLSQDAQRFATVFGTSFERFFEARFADGKQFPETSNEERLVMAAYAKLAYGFRFRIDSRFLRETRGRACLRGIFERIRAERKLRRAPLPPIAERAAECRRRFSLDSIFDNPFREIARGASFDRADVLLLSERGDDCTPLFFVSRAGKPLRLESIADTNDVAVFAPATTIGEYGTFSLADISSAVFDNITVNGSVAKFELSPEPWYYRRESSAEPHREIGLCAGFEVRAAGAALSQDDIVRSSLSRLRAQRIFETRFRRLLEDRRATFLVPSPYDVRLRGAFHAFDRLFPDAESFRRAVRGGDGTVFELVRSLAMAFPRHVRAAWRANLPLLAAKAWGADAKDSDDTGIRAVWRDSEEAWTFPEARPEAALDVRAFWLGAATKHVFAVAIDRQWRVVDFDRERYVSLAMFLRSCDAYALEARKTSRLDETGREG